MKRLLSFLLTAAMIVGLLTVPVFAADESKTVHFYSDDPRMDNVYLFVMNPAWWGQVETGDWPGTKLTKGEDGWYSFEFENDPLTTNYFMMFNNDNGGNTPKQVKWIQAIIQEPAKYTTKGLWMTTIPSGDEAVMDNGSVEISLTAFATKEEAEKALGIAPVEPPKTVDFPIELPLPFPKVNNDNQQGWNNDSVGYEPWQQASYLILEAESMSANGPLLYFQGGGLGWTEGATAFTTEGKYTVIDLAASMGDHYSWIKTVSGWLEFYLGYYGSSGGVAALGITGAWLSDVPTPPASNEIRTEVPVTEYYDGAGQLQSLPTAEISSWGGIYISSWDAILAEDPSELSLEFDVTFSDSALPSTKWDGFEVIRMYNGDSNGTVSQDSTNPANGDAAGQYGILGKTTDSKNMVYSAPLELLKAADHFGFNVQICQAALTINSITIVHTVEGEEPPPTYTISGKVTDGTDPVERAGVQLKDGTGTAVSGKTATSGADGSFSIAGVLEGSYILTATKDLFTATTDPFTVSGDTTQNIVLDMDIEIPEVPRGGFDLGGFKARNNDNQVGWGVDGTNGVSANDLTVDIFRSMRYLVLELTKAPDRGMQLIFQSDADNWGWNQTEGVLGDDGEPSEVATLEGTKLTIDLTKCVAYDTIKFGTQIKFFLGYGWPSAEGEEPVLPNIGVAGLGILVAYLMPENVPDEPGEPEPENPLKPSTPGSGGVPWISDPDNTPDEDIPSAWAEEAVIAALERGIVPEALQGGYRTVLTRAEFCGLAVEIYELISGAAIDPKADAFSDTDNEDVAKLAALGIVTGGTGGLFNPDGAFSREMTMTLMYKMLVQLGYELELAEPDFADAANISPWAREAIGALQKAGIIGGDGVNFNPKADFTRQMGIVTVMQFLDYLEG
ncbi:MAG: S-layer homology domain-containing protein [Oscillospiraceae bacterium]|jgi:hypothetical protein|nr:S-layer homology domain-containing protein [Oscillospiraceae bacterium]